MKCPKCGYHSFDHLDSCKKCSSDLVEHKSKFNLRGFFFPGQAAAPVPEPAIDEIYQGEDASADDSVDFGFDFLDEEGDPTAKATEDISLNANHDVNIDQPFGADSETIPADAPEDSASDSDDKPGKGPEFAF